jgi:predicted TIM-barrel fold metal-dependent hydrolase
VPSLSYDVVSADSHVIEPHDLWAKSLPREFQERAPRLVHHASTDVLICDDADLPPVGLLAGCFRTGEDVRKDGRWDDDVPSGAYDPDARLDYLAKDGVDAEVIFPTIGMMLYPIEDFKFRWALLRGYNTWLAEAFCAPQKDRFFGIAMLNHEDVDMAIAEVCRVKAMGLSGIMLPLFVDDDAPYWDHRFDPLWAAAIDQQMPVHFHIFTSRAQKLAFASVPQTPGQRFAASAGLVQSVLLDMMAYGVFDRFPGLRVVSVENDAGWAGHLIESSEFRWHRLQILGAPRSKHEPSHYFHHNIRVTFTRDRTAVLTREIIGGKTLMWGSDFPHHMSTWPNSREVLDRHFHDQPREVRDAFVRDNVREHYHI